MAYKGYFFDLDGVAYLGTQVIPTCRDFVNRLIEQNKQVCFLTNNSSKSPVSVAKRLQDMGYHITEAHVITSSQVTAYYLSEQHANRVHMIGMKGLYDELSQLDLEIVESDAEYVVVGLDFELTYEKLAHAIKEIRNGATFISTNSDIKLLTADGLIPGNGAISELLAMTTDVPPLYMGKPEPLMFELGLKRLNLNKEDVVMVGDNYHTDIIGAIRYQIDSIFVETGVMTKEQIQEFPVQPTFIVKDLSHFSA